MPLDVGRVTHLIEQMHRSEDDAGMPIVVGKVLVTDGARGFTWETFVSGLGGGAVTFLDHGNVGASETIDQSAAVAHWITLGANCALTFAGAVATVGGEPVECELILYIEQDGTGSWTLTWPASVVWPSSTAPTLTTTAGAVDIIRFRSPDGGVTWYGDAGGSGSSFTLTVQDEGTPLSTGATTLNFVGAGVTASGSGATKTITIDGGATSTDASLWRPLMDGAGNVVTDGTGQAVMAFGAA